MPVRWRGSGLPFERSVGAARVRKRFAAGWRQIRILHAMASETRSPKRRQTSASTGSRQAPAPAAVYSGRTISWRHCLIGVVAGEVALLVISNVGLIATNAAFGGTSSIDGGVVGVSTLLAVIFGGWLAGRLARRL